MDREEENLLPKATIAKFVKANCPSYIKSSPEFRELLGRCATEFVQLVCSEANDICSKRKKNQIGEGHLLEALETLGFEDLVEQSKAVAQQATDGRKRRKNAKAAKKSNKSDEQLRAEQEALFARARARMETSASSLADSTPPPPQS